MKTQKPIPAPLDLEGLVKLAVTRGSNSYDASLRRQLNAAWGPAPAKEYVLESQNRGSSRWSRNAQRLPVADELAAMLLAIFPQPSAANHFTRCHSWLTLAGICKRLGHSDVATKVATALKAAEAAKAAAQSIAAQRRLSDVCVEFSRTLSKLLLNSGVIPLPTAPYTALLAAEPLRSALAAFIEAVPYQAQFEAGAVVKVPGTGYSTREGIVLSTAGRQVRVDLKQPDNSAAVEEFDVLDVRAQ